MGEVELPESLLERVVMCLCDKSIFGGSYQLGGSVYVLCNMISNDWLVIVYIDYSQIDNLIW